MLNRSPWDLAGRRSAKGVVDGHVPTEATLQNTAGSHIKRGNLLHNRGKQAVYQQKLGVLAR